MVIWIEDRSRKINLMREYSGQISSWYSTAALTTYILLVVSIVVDVFHGRMNFKWETWSYTCLGMKTFVHASCSTCIYNVQSAVPCVKKEVKEVALYGHLNKDKYTVLNTLSSFHLSFGWVELIHRLKEGWDTRLALVSCLSPLYIYASIYILATHFCSIYRKLAVGTQSGTSFSLTLHISLFIHRWKCGCLCPQKEKHATSSYCLPKLLCPSGSKKTFLR